MRIGTGILVWCFCAAVASAAVGETLALDHLSFVHFEGASEDFKIPGGSIKLKLRRVSSDEWSVRVDPSDPQILEFMYRSGKRVRSNPRLHLSNREWKHRR